MQRHAQRAVHVPVAGHQQHRAAGLPRGAHGVGHGDVARDLHPRHGPDLRFGQQAAVAVAHALLLLGQRGGRQAQRNRRRRGERGDGAGRRGVPGGEQAVIGGDEVTVAFVFGYRCEIRLPHVGVDMRGTAVVVPVDFTATQQEDAAEHQLGDAVGVCLRVGEPERRTPRTAEHLPALDAEVCAQRLHVGDQLGSGVHREVGAVGDVQPTRDMVMAPGFGDEGFAVDTKNPEAQAWFDHGVRLRWAFEHSESVRAFRKARQLDPSCGMCAWGEAGRSGRT